MAGEQGEGERRRGLFSSQDLPVCGAAGRRGVLAAAVKEGGCPCPVASFFWGGDTQKRRCPSS